MFRENAKKFEGGKQSDGRTGKKGISQEKRQENIVRVGIWRLVDYVLKLAICLSEGKNM